MRGFSLIEVIVAVSILSTGIVASTALINRTISAGLVVRNQLVAVNLAQEGMEVIHNIRHTNWIEEAVDGTTEWDDGLIDGNSCVQFDSTALISAGTCGDINLNERMLYIFNDGTNINYTHILTATPTNFFRHINISSGDDDGTPYKLINSTVFWGNTSISVVERLYNWKQL